MTERPTTLRRIALAWGILVLVVAVVAGVMAASAGPLYRGQLITLAAAFDLMRKGAWIGLGSGVAALVGLAAALFARRSAAAAAAALALAIGVAAFAWPYALDHARHTTPPIHDIATNPAAPARFVALAAVRRATPNGLVYGDGGPGAARREGLAIERFLASPGALRDPRARKARSACRTWGPRCLAAMQAAYYPGIRPLAVPGASPSRVYSAALAVVHAMKWKIAAADATTHHLEATATSHWFGLKDDVAIDVTADGSGSLVNMRSESRLLINDGGENARRVRDFLDRLAKRLLARG